MAMTKLKLALGASIVLTIGMALVVEHQGQARLREENSALRQRLAQAERLKAENRPLARKPRLPTPAMAAVGPSPQTPPDELRPANLLAPLLKGEEFTLRPEQVEPYLQ